jgi:prophage regulatory protein
MENTPQTQHRLLRRTKLEQKIGLSRSTIYARLDKKSPHYDPTFPLPIILGVASIAWVEAEIENWVASRIAARLDRETDSISIASEEKKTARAKARAVAKANKTTSAKPNTLNLKGA